MLLLALLLSTSPNALRGQDRSPQPATAGRTIVVVIADDLGVDQVGVYRDVAGVPSERVPNTPNLDALAARGVLFRNAYANPLCSPTRAAALTGRFACRQGVGGVTGRGFGEPFDDAEVTLPELLRAAGAGFTSAAIGKWHLGYEWSDPNTHLGRDQMVNDNGGFDWFCGTCNNLMHDGDSHTHYLRRTLRRNPADPDRPTEVEPDAVQTRFSAVEQVDSALAVLDERHTPLAQDVYLHLCFNVPHEPWQKPPDELHSLDERLGDVWQKMPDRWDEQDPAVARLYYEAMVEAMDTEIGRLLRDLPAARKPGTTVLFFGDNGTPQQTTVAPFVPSHAKGTLFEGGIHVPLIVAGAGVDAAPGSVVDQLVQVTDVFATVADLAGVPAERQAEAIARPLDSLSLRPLLDGDPENDRDWPRWWAFAERFAPNGGEGDPMETIDARDAAVVAPALEGFARPQLGAVTIRVEGEPFTIGNRARVVLSGAPGRRCVLRTDVCLVPLDSGFVASSLVGPTPDGDGRLLAGTGVTIASPSPGVFNLFDLEITPDAADERVVFELDGDLAARFAGTECHVLFQALVLGDGGPIRPVGASNIVAVRAPRNVDVKAIRDARFKLILTDNGGKEQMYDLEADPFEQRDLLSGGAVALPEVARAHYTRLRRQIDLIVTASAEAAEGIR
ncbi:MAG: sulfatase-like hydrolase/transferase [Planctomycetes bacterium]|nr:sulfatase-like hydrolase/transferase [Planctomycetota bacterium]